MWLQCQRPQSATVCGRVVVVEGGALQGEKPCLLNVGLEEEAAMLFDSMDEALEQTFAAQVHSSLTWMLFEAEASMAGSYATKGTTRRSNG